METTLWQTIITGIIMLLSGSGGVFIYFTSKAKHKQHVHESAISEWKQLYDEMRNRLDEQEKENQSLKNELNNLRTEITKLRIEISTYKKYDNYISMLEKYVDHLLHTSKGLLSEDAYKNLCAKRPIRIDDSVDDTFTTTSYKKKNKKEVNVNDND